jgi:putative membrane-bound dehydrogenase-like protein
MLSLVAAACFSANMVAADQTVYDVGVAKVDITPDYPIRLNGFGGRRTESEGVTQPIWAKALAIGSDDVKPLILITIDSLGVRLSMVEKVAERLKEKAGIERDRIAVTFTHSHTTPKLNGVSDTIFSTPIPPQHQEHIDRYDRELTDALERVALAALADRKPSSLEWAIGKVGFAKNRRTEGGPVDHDLPVLLVKSADTNEVRAVYVTYACHCVTLSNNKISGDWAGYAAEAIERNNPGAIALVSIGCGSDANPSSGVTGDNIAVAAEQGAEIASEVERLKKLPLKPISGPVAATLRNIDLPLKKLPTREQLVALARHDSPEGYNAKFQLAKLDRGEMLQAAIDFPIQTWTFGDSLAMVFLAGEVCADYSIRLKQELHPDRVWIHGYANDFCCYVPSERLLREGGYGGGAEVVYFALPTTLMAGMEQKIIDEVHRQVPQEFHREAAGKPTSSTQPTSPADAIEAIQTADEMIVELVAAEPLIASPVTIDFGKDGRLWVVEMTDYSRGADDAFEHTGSIKVLIDRNNDGKFDESTTFATGLRFPTDVKAWRNGVIVCDAPDVLFLEDTDGDDRADVRKVLLTGFATHNAQARVNSLRWGIDNWIYGSCGLFGGEVRSFSGKTVNLRCDFRFKPDTGDIEPVTGCTQQGRARDDWGNWFGCDSGALCDHYPLTDKYLARNPYVLPPAAEVSVPTSGDASRLFPVGKTVLFRESGPPGRPTSVCGLAVYRDELLGAEFRGNVFVAEPVNQLVHRRILAPRGITFTGVRAAEESQREFLASSDNWFRPVQIRTGLDGCLWIVDMCRYVIEHPRFIPMETLSELDPMAGRNAGRIFRVRPRAKSARPVMRFDELDISGLVAAIESPNGPQRDLAHQILVERGDLAAAPLLEKLAASAAAAESRLQALCALDGLGVLGEEAVLRALKDPHTGVRRHAIRLSEPLLNGSPNVANSVLALVDDADPPVQLQIAYTLGEWRDPRAAVALAKLARRHHADDYLLAAVLSSVNKENAPAVAREILTQAKDAQQPSELRDGLAMIITKLGDRELLIDAFRTVARLADGHASPPQLATLAELLKSLDAQQRQIVLDDKNAGTDLRRVAELARGIVQDPEATEPARVVALQIMAAVGADQEVIASELGALLGPNSPLSVQQQVIPLLADVDAKSASDTLLANWSSLTPSVRSQILDVFYSRHDMLPHLLVRIEAGDIKASQLDALQRQRLLMHADASIRSAAESAFAGSINPDRTRVIETFAAAARTPGNVAQGRLLFQKHCASCHELENYGHKVGPDLAAMTSRTPSALLEALFDPNRSVDERYQSYTSVTDEGRVFTGILVRETSNSVTLVEQEGKEHTLLRNTLDDFKNSGVSLMPEGFEKDLSATDVSDLFSYMSSQVVPPKQVAGNRPEVIRTDSDGIFWLLAANAKIYGGDITFEPPTQNIGYWHGPQDYVAWDLEVEADGSFDVYLNWACSDDTAGSLALVEGLDAPIRTVVRTTHGFDRYETIRLSTAGLAKGTNRIIVRPEDTLATRSLMDLRGLYLVPAGQPSRRAETGAPPGLKITDAASRILAIVKRTKVGTRDEYENIPKIWETALAAGRRNQPAEIRRVLAISLPNADEPMQHWQAVVLGGGIINGLSQVGCSPRARILELLDGKSALLADWNRAMQLAGPMADDKSVRIGTRYDALRLLGAETFERSGSRLVKYLHGDEHDELTMGAISGLADMDASPAIDAIIAAFPDYSRSNQELAISLLLQNEPRIKALLGAIEGGAISSDALSAEQWLELKQTKDENLRTRITALHAGRSRKDGGSQSTN